MDNNKIIIIGAKENNLKNISLDIDKHKFNVVTGVSGSGKSSLVFDRIYASAQSSLYTEIFTYLRLLYSRIGFVFTLIKHALNQ